MSKLIDYLSAKLKIASKSLLEKDLLLHRILSKLSQDASFAAQYAFKGGTCLIKCYYGYYRFSEDLDFTFIDQKEFAGKSQKEVSRVISSKLSGVFALVGDIAGKLALDFKTEKSNTRYIEYGGSKKFATLKLWYPSSVRGEESFVKIQFNFVECLFYPVRVQTAHSLIRGIDEKEFSFLFPEESLLINPLKILAYDIREILLEKCRAILTRKGTKARDFVDIFLILHREMVDLKGYRKQIIEKTAFMLTYEKYLKNLASFDTKKFVLGEEEKLLLEELPQGLEKSVAEVTAFLTSISQEIQAKK